MIKKQGITITMLVITIIILVILAGTITFSVYSTLDYSRLSTWANEMMYIQDIVDEKLNTSSILLDTMDTVNINVSSLDATQKEEQFSGETITVGNLVELYMLDLSKLGITDTMYGKQNTQLDVYALSMDTGRVYYAQGFEVEDRVYYTLTAGLKQRFELTSTANLNSVVFMPNKIGYTNEAVKVTIKVPQAFSNVAISTSNTEIQLGSQNVEGSLYTYVVNTTNVLGNYTITVSYNDGVQTKTASYIVSGYDVKKPVIQPITRDNWAYKETDKVKTEYIVDITATDESGIKKLKYASEKIEEKDAKEYFKTNGNNIIDGKINLNKNLDVYTIYAEDYAGNFVITTVNVTKLKGWIKDGFTVVKGGDVLQIGDTINYTATGTAYNGGWKVLGADEKGNLLIVSATNVKENHRLGYESTMTTDEEKLSESIKDMETGVAQLNAVCEPYGYGKGVVGIARSITPEDVNGVTGYNPEIEQYGKGKLYQYGNEIMYKYNGTANPVYESVVESGTLSDIHDKGFYYYNGEKVVHVNDLTSGMSGNVFVTLTSNSYYYAASILTTISSTDNAKAYSMIFENDSIKYWLASMCIDLNTTRGDFGPYMVENGYLRGYSMFDSCGNAYYGEFGIRAVVTLSYDINLTGSSETGWSY